jgi:hypothetical protein
MFLLSVVSLAIASVSAFFSLSVQEEVVKVALACTAVFAIFLTLVCAPWSLKLTLVAIPLVVERVYSLSLR